MNLRTLLEHLLSEQLLCEDIEEIAEYPEGFDRWELKNIKSHPEQLAYIRNHLEFLGQGSSRLVFAGDKNTVLKVATNKAGVDQNKAEVSAYNRARSKPYTDLITNVFEYDPEYLWIESERAAEAAYHDWKRVIGMSWDSFSDAIERYFVFDNKKGNYLSPKEREKFHKVWPNRLPPRAKATIKTKIFQDIVSMVNDLGMMPSDLESEANWGIVIRGGTARPVIVDYGLSKKVYKKHYRDRGERGLAALTEQALEEQLQEDVDEIAAYPEGFDIKEFVGLRSMAAKTRYLKQHNLDKLGAGSARAVFVADPTTVIKVAKNAKGLAQNEAEIDISNNTSEDAPIANVKDFDDVNYSYVEMERARKAKPPDFQNMVGFKMDDIMNCVQIWADRNNGREGWRTKPENYEQIIETPFVQGILEVIGNFDMAVGDITRISSWGAVNRDGKEHLVLVDYGTTMDVYRRLYRLR